MKKAALPTGSSYTYLNKILLVTILSLFYISGISQDAVGDYRSNATSFNWSTAASWQVCTVAGNPGTFATASAYPGQNSGSGKVTIRNGNTITLDVSPANAISSLAVGEGTSGTFFLKKNNTQSLTITNGLTILSGAKFDPENGNNGNYTFNIGGDIANAGTISTVTTKVGVSFNFNGTTPQTVSGTGAAAIINTTIANTAGVTFNLTLTSTGTTVINTNTTLTLNASFTNATTTANGTLRLNTGSAIATAPTYSNTSTLYYNTAAATTGKEWSGTGTAAGAGVPQNVTLDLTSASNAISLAAARTVPGTLNFIKGLLTTSTFVLTANTISGASATTGWVNGNLIKPVSTGASTKAYEVGDATAYTPASLSFTGVTTSGNIQVAAKTPLSSHTAIGTLSLDRSTNVLNRYWQVIKPGSSAFAGGSYTGTFSYIASDLTGANTAFRTAIYSGSWAYPGTATAGTLQITTPSGIIPAATSDVAFADPRTVTISGITVTTKVYDGTTTATLNLTGAAINGVVNGNTVTINSSAATAVFDNKNVATGKTVTVSGFVIAGAGAGAYVLSAQPSVTGTVTSRPITVTAANNTKPYDGNTSAAAIPTVTTGSIVTGDIGNFTEVYQDAGAGTGKTLIPLGSVTDGNNGNNYSYTFVNRTTGVITSLPIGSADFRTKASGVFSDYTNVWEFDQGGGSWATATAAPVSTNNISVRHKLTLDKNLTVGAGKTFTLETSLLFTDTFKISSSNTLSVTGTANFNGRPIVIASAANGSGAIGRSLGTINGATNVTVERYIPANSNRAWRLLAIPTGGSQSIHDSWQEGQPVTINGLPGYGTFLTSSSANALASGFDYKTPGNSMFSYSSATDALIGIPGTGNAIATTSGYFVYLRGDRSVTPSSSIIGTTATTLRTTGSIYTGTQPAITIPADQSVLVGNIYPSAIDVTRLVLGGGAANTAFYLWDPSLAGSQGLGAYQTLTFNGGVYEITPGDGSYPSEGSIFSTIQSGQAFFVEATGSDGTIQFVENAKGSGSTSNVFSAPVTKRLSAKLYTVTANGRDLSDGTTQLFDDSFSNDVDALDAKKHYNFGENFYITKNGKDLVVEKHKLLTGRDTIYFAIESLKSKSYQFEFNARELEADNLTAMLEDSYTQISTPVSLAGITTIAFSVDSKAASKAVDRFRLVFKSNSVLAVGITNAKAYATANTNIVEWSVSNQQDALSYQVERSFNGIDFANVATITSTGTNYRWIDKSPAQGNNFYRIAILENNGDRHYSQVMKVSVTKNTGISISPNLITNGVINMQFGSMPTGTYRVRFISTSGSVLAVKQFHYDGVGIAQTVNIPGTLATGSYTLEIIHPDKTRTAQPVVIGK